MNRSRILLRVTAVFSSLSLMAVFVAYRAGAFGSRHRPPAESRKSEMMSGSKSRVLITPDEASAPAKTLPGSKSLILVEDSPLQSALANHRQKAGRTKQPLIHGTKSGVPIVGPALGEKEPPAAEMPATAMPKGGSVNTAKKLPPQPLSEAKGAP